MHRFQIFNDYKNLTENLTSDPANPAHKMELTRAMREHERKKNLTDGLEDIPDCVFTRPTLNRP